MTVSNPVPSDWRQPQRGQSLQQRRLPYLTLERITDCCCLLNPQLHTSSPRVKLYVKQEWTGGKCEHDTWHRILFIGNQSMRPRRADGTIGRSFNVVALGKMLKPSRASLGIFLHMNLICYMTWEDPLDHGMVDLRFEIWGIEI